MSASQHTPTPWAVDFGGTVGHIKSIGVNQPANQHWKPTPTVARYDESVTAHSLTDAERSANAAFIVRACNSHEALVDACYELVRWAEQNAMWDKCGQSYYKAKKALELAKL